MSIFETLTTEQQEAVENLLRAESMVHQAEEVYDRDGDQGVPEFVAHDYGVAMAARSWARKVLSRTGALARYAEAEEPGA